MTYGLLSNLFPLMSPERWRDIKDPCPVFDDVKWHMFGSCGTVLDESWDIFHATSPTLSGPWIEHDQLHLDIHGSGVAAPGVIFEDGLFHMFVQTEFQLPDGTIEYLTSNDGFAWTHVNTALHSVPDTPEHGIYDPHPAVIGGERYFVYSGMPAFELTPKPDVYLARSMTDSWEGPWLRLGKILDHAEIADHHNSRDHPDYEWGIEGPQLVELSSGKVLLNATCFLPEGDRGHRQRVFFAIARSIQGPYLSIGPVLVPQGTGENGHSTVLLDGELITLCYQTRLDSTDHKWRYGLATYDLLSVIPDSRLLECQSADQ